MVRLLTSLFALFYLSQLTFSQTDTTSVERKHCIKLEFLVSGISLIRYNPEQEFLVGNIGYSYTLSKSFKLQTNFSIAKQSSKSEVILTPSTDHGGIITFDSIRRESYDQFSASIKPNLQWFFIEPSHLLNGFYFTPGICITYSNKKQDYEVLDIKDGWLNTYERREDLVIGVTGGFGYQRQFFSNRLVLDVVYAPYLFFGTLNISKSFENDDPDRSEELIKKDNTHIGGVFIGYQF